MGLLLVSKVYGFRNAHPEAPLQVLHIHQSSAEDTKRTSTRAAELLAVCAEGDLRHKEGNNEALLEPFLYEAERWYSAQVMRLVSRVEEIDLEASASAHHMPLMDISQVNLCLGKRTDGLYIFTGSHMVGWITLRLKLDIQVEGIHAIGFQVKLDS